MAGETYYDVLGVSPGAETTMVRKAYVSQARRYHPDFHVRDEEAVRQDAEARMRSINEAWAVLGRRDKREKYDRELRNTGRAAASEPAGSARRTAGPNGSAPVAERTSGTSLPRWLVMAPVLCLVMAFFSFVVGFVTSLTGLLAAGLAFALGGAVLFVVAPVVAVKRAKQG